MKKAIFVSILLTLFAAPMPAQVDSLRTAKEIIQVVTLDPSSQDHLISIDESAKPSSLKDLWQMPNGMNSVNLAFWISLIALIVSIIAIVAQFITAKNTANAPYECQLQQFEDLIRHFYRNLVCTKAMRDKFLAKTNNPQKYPSEIHYLKLKSLPEDAILPINNKLYPRLHELKLLIRNYNADIDVALRHIVRKDLDKNVIDGDYDNLLYKPYALTAKILNTEDAIARSRYLYFWKPRGKKLLDKSIYIILLEHFIKLSVKENEEFIENEATLDLSSSSIQAHSDVLLSGARAFEQWMKMFRNTQTFEYVDINTKSTITAHTRFFEKDKIIRYIQGIKPGSDAISRACTYLQSIKSTSSFEETPQTSLLEQYKRLLGQEKWDVSQILYFALHIDSIIEEKKVIKLIDYEA